MHWSYIFLALTHQYDAIQSINRPLHHYNVTNYDCVLWDSFLGNIYFYSEADHLVNASLMVGVTFDVVFS